MFLSYFTLLTALSLSVVAAWYSILGLTAIFASAVIPIIIMGSILEVAKVTVTVWLHEYWHRCRLLMKFYLVPAVAMLMVITSMGIFGFLSKAHSDQSLVSGDVISKIAIYDEKIKTQKDNIEANRRALKQMDEGVDSVLGRSTDEKGADKAVALRKAQQKERVRLQAEILQSQKSIAELTDARAPIAAEVRKVEAEVGPIKYIAAFIYGDNPDSNLLERAVRWVIIILVVVFDPLAIMMVLSATESLKWERERRLRPAYEADDGPLTEQQVEQLREIVEPELPQGEVVKTSSLFDEESKDPHTPGWMYGDLQSHPLSDQEVEEVVAEFDRARHAYLDRFDHFKDLKPIVAPVTQTIEETHDEDLDSAPTLEKTLAKAWKSENPNDTLKHQRQMLEEGVINELPWENSTFQARVLGLTGLEADNAPTGATGEVRGFGTSFPVQASKGDMFLRVDQLPSVLYKFNGTMWIAVDKNLTDSYAYDDAYIDHLIDKITTGEYDPELLSEAERDHIEQRLKNKFDKALDE
jgi:hypothetical protein